MRVFISGITGTLGQELLKLFLADDQVDHIVGYSRCELKQKQIPKNDKLTLYIGDVRDQARLLEATRKTDVIFHLAALKHVDTLELNPEEAIKTNVVGTVNILHCQRMNRVPRVVFTSTDKAVFPINAYGMSKALAEKLVLRNPANIVCRYGNVMASRGSVIPLIAEALIKKESVKITDPLMTRFWILPSEVAKFVKDSILGGSDGPLPIRIPSMPACSMVNLVEEIASILGVTKYEVDIVGPRPGEKIHESIDDTKTSHSVAITTNITHEIRSRLIHLDCIQEALKRLC